MNRLCLAAVAALALCACSNDEVTLGGNGPCADAGVACVTDAGRVCVDLQRSAEHCGACGARCADAGACHRGACCANACGGRCMGSETRAVEVTAGRESMGQHLVDIDRDGYADALSVNQLSEDMTVAWGNAQGAVTSTETWPIRRVNGDVAFGDLDGDGDLDMVATVQTNGPPTALHVGVYLRDGARARPPAPTLLAEPDNPDTIVLADFDGDGDLDLVTHRQDTGCLSLRLGDGHGDFAEGRCVAMVSQGVSRPGGIVVPLAALDVDGDRRAELILLENEALKVLRVDQARGPATPEVLHRFSPELVREVLPTFDLDGDGRVEFGVSVPNGDGSRHAEWVAIGRDGRAAPVCSTPTGPMHFTSVGDFDGDGLPDAVAGRGCTNCPDTLVVQLRR